MRRRTFVTGLPALLGVTFWGGSGSIIMRRAAWAGTSTPEAPKTIRGKLTQSEKEGEPPALTISPNNVVPLEGDESTTGVLHDARLRGEVMELVGHFRDPTHFVVDPIHTKAMFVLKDGKRLMISYWCEVCSIRTYTPGVCMCCQDETELDLKESFSR
jgi:hypothetical protein